MEVSVAVLHSSSLREDGVLLMKILPDRFDLETPLENSLVSLSFFSAGRPGKSHATSIMVYPIDRTTTTASKQKPARSYATVLLDNEAEIMEMAERAAEEGVVVEEVTVGQNHLAKFVLSGGCCVGLTTSSAWSSPSSRSVAMEFMMEAPVSGSMPLQDDKSNEGSIKRRFMSLTPKGKSSVGSAEEQLGSESAMRRSTSMPTLIPPIVTTTPSQNRAIPTVRTRVLSTDGSLTPFPLNSQMPIPIESDLFVGKLVLVMRPNDPPRDDPFWNERIFSKKKRRVIMQLQGKLKYKPTGTLYAGMEISDPMNLGLIASGLCNIILKLTKSFNSALHYSFGIKGKEQAHISFPASTFFERMVVTPPGENPPDIMEEFDEDPQSAKLRKAYKTKIDWNTEDTYSMSFHSMYIDFPSWSVVQLPVGKDVPLKTFWGDSTASVVLYEVPRGKEDAQHLSSTNRKVLMVEMKFLGHDALALDDRGSDDNTELSEEMTEIEAGSVSTKGDATLMPPLDEEDEDLEFFDSVESQAMLPDGPGIDVKLEPTGPHNSVLGVIDEFCPCWIDMYAKKGKYQKVYAFCSKQQVDRTLFRTSKTAELSFGEPSLVEVDDRFSPRMSSEERVRRILGLKYAEAHVEKGKRAQLHRFEKMLTRFDTQFLSREDRASKKLPGPMSGYVARALSDRHWIEERIVLHDQEITFHHMDKSKVHCQISIESIVGVSVPDKDSGTAPYLPSFFFLQVETFGRVHYLMFHSVEVRDTWMSAIGSLVTSHPSSRTFTNHLFEVDDPMKEFLHKSSMWDYQKRRILNCRGYSFQTARKTSRDETLQLAETALKKVMSLQPKGPNDADLREFLDCAASLKDADAYALNEDERLAFFLNVYHVFIMHAYIVLRPPDSSLEWLNYFNTIAYQCSDDIFSLAELEHNVIRAEMKSPSQFLSRFVLPKSHYLFALTQPDFRINFALNPGSLSMPSSSVPLYRPERLDKQLDAVTKQFLGATVAIKHKGSKDVSIVLPRVCQWFGEDFGSQGSASDVLVKIQEYLSKERRDALEVIWNPKKECFEIGIFSLKYLPYSWDCRFLTLQTA
ncbi:MAG: hypothetical protein SGILL_000580 [Bacillariaceae sp.]